MQNSLKLGIVRGPLRSNSESGSVFEILGARDGFAIDFRKARMLVRDSGNPANNYDGDPKGKLTIFGQDAWSVDPVKGLELSAVRDFAIAMATNSFPFNPAAIHVYARFSLNSADSAEQRYLFMVDNVGADRYAMYTTSGVGFRWVTGDGTTSDTETSNLSLTAGVEYRAFCGADAYGRSWVDDGGTQTNDTLLSLATSTPTHVGIGGYNNQVLRVLDGYLAEIAVVCADIALEKRMDLQQPFQRLYGAEGDSHTFNVSFGMPAAEFYPARISAATASGLAVRNAGGSGESSAQMLGQAADFLSKGAPDIATIYAGSNDVDTAVSATATPTLVTFDVVDSTKIAVGGFLVVNGESREVVGLTGNAVTLASPLSSVPLIGAIVAIDTRANIENWVQAMKAAGVGIVAVIGSHYLNFPTAGDTPDVEQSLRGAVRLKQRAAAAAAGVPYVDTYAYMRQLVLSGVVAQGDWAVWHQGVDNTHLNAAGEQVLADAIRAALFA